MMTGLGLSLVKRINSSLGDAIEELISLTVDTTNYTSDSTNISADQTLIQE